MALDESQTLASFRADGVIVCESHLERDPFYTRLYVVRTADTAADGDLWKVRTNFVPYDDLARFLGVLDESDDEVLLDVYQAQERPRGLSE
jgi:hypothetical protein